ncbi:hypothetical protein [Streptomyces sp. NPDC005336]|uniref:hypothetical protein n=1 Tax=unclassified Streptomyces TaxID=2593676 RepID=UPI0033B93051
MTDTVTPEAGVGAPRRSYARLAADESREDLCCSLDAECGDVCRKEPRGEPVLMPLPTVRTATLTVE